MDRPTRRRVLSTSAVSLALIAGCSSPSGGGDGDGGDGGGPTVDMNDEFEFVPGTIEASTGETVTWENVGTVDHSVTAYEDDIPDGAEYFASGGFDSEQAARDGWPQGAIGEDGSYEHTFETAGTYDYFCFPHEGVGMVGTVEVS